MQHNVATIEEGDARKAGNKKCFKTLLHSKT